MHNDDSGHCKHFAFDETTLCFVFFICLFLHKNNMLPESYLGDAEDAHFVVMSPPISYGLLFLFCFTES
jgi:hypothetical protein